MKKKLILFITATALMVLSSGCYGAVSTRGELPYGVWESEEPYIMIDIPYNHEGRYTGKYEKNGEIVDIVVMFEVSHKGIEIHDAIVNVDNVFAEDTWYFAGTYTYTKNKLVYKLPPHFAEMHGFSKITFKKTAGYEKDSVVEK